VRRCGGDAVVTLVENRVGLVVDREPDRPAEYRPGSQMSALSCYSLPDEGRCGDV
jgi:hypothetical protein